MLNKCTYTYFKIKYTYTYLIVQLNNRQSSKFNLLHKIKLLQHVNLNMFKRKFAVCII